MAQRATTSRRSLALGAVALLALAACGTNEKKPDREAAVDLGDVEQAVMAATPRVVGLGRAKRVVEGFGHALLLDLRTDSAQPMTAEQLDSVVRAIWTGLPWEPNGLSLTAGPEDSDSAIDLRSAAAQLAPMGSQPYGQGGVSLFDLAARYGAWRKPA
jgi:hypothetical protein